MILLCRTINMIILVHIVPLDSSQPDYPGAGPSSSDIVRSTNLPFCSQSLPSTRRRSRERRNRNISRGISLVFMNKWCPKCGLMEGLIGLTGPTEKVWNSHCRQFHNLELTFQWMHLTNVQMKFHYCAHEDQSFNSISRWPWMNSNLCKI